MEEQEFFLVIQSQHQRQLYRHYASRIVCVDSTHGTNAYNYKLITMMVCDDWGQGKRFTVERRVYSVPGPNSLWHIDGNYKYVAVHPFYSEW